MQEESKIAPESNLEKHFNFQLREAELYKLWEDAKIFCPESAKDQSAPVFNISMPPPNANGELHLGHSFGYTVMDILGRFHRLLGERVLLLPGKDHAGIQTQVVYEKKLKAEKVDIKAKTTEQLYKDCYAFCADRAQYMRAQEKMLGLSADWERELFTLDPRLSNIVYETFEKMWKDGLVYKGTRIVNWSVFSQTSISDVEVEYKEQDGGLWYISYPLEQPYSSQDEITLPNGTKLKIGQQGMVTATTRPETMLGDTALAVHPEDPRYQGLIGKNVIVPLVNRKIPIIADKRVDPAYGTGVIKVTPPHDFTDYEIGQEHKLPSIQVIGKDGRMTSEAGAAYEKLTTTECRNKVVLDLQAAGLLLDQTTIKHKVPIGERGKDIIEPLISEQWFVNVDKPGNSLKQRALALLRDKQIKIYPERFQVLFEQWLENLHDWNISRQLWWGHRLPVWYKEGSNKKEIFVGQNPPKESTWIPETDIFDTWFSSGQWAFSTMAASGFYDLNKADPSKDYFPTHSMVMGRDILLFWACRMLLLTVYRTGTAPWKNIFFTGLIRDEHGQKMSKSKGNGIQPNEVIAKFGTDSLRLALVMGATPGNDISIGEKKIEGYSKFTNKLWNAAKLIEMKLAGLPALPKAVPEIKLDSSKWLLGTLAHLHDDVTKKLNEYDISIAANELYNFTWTVFCDWYLEMFKALIDKGTPEQKMEASYVATTTFRTVLTMLHPVMPFITEEIYQKLTCIKSDPLLAAAPWSYNGPRPKTETEIPVLLEIVNAVRSVKSALGLPHKRIRIAMSKQYSAETLLLLSELARVDFCLEGEIPKENALRKPFSDGTIVCEVEGKDTYRKKLEKDLEANRLTLTSLENKLSGAFASQAKPEIVEKERERLAATKNVISELEKELQLAV